MISAKRTIVHSRIKRCKVKRRWMRGIRMGRSAEERRNWMVKWSSWHVRGRRSRSRRNRRSNRRRNWTTDTERVARADGGGDDAVAVARRL